MFLVLFWCFTTYLISYLFFKYLLIYSKKTPFLTWPLFPDLCKKKERKKNPTHFSASLLFLPAKTESAAAAAATSLTLFFFFAHKHLTCTFARMYTHFCSVYAQINNDATALHTCCTVGFFAEHDFLPPTLHPEWLHISPPL